MFRTPLGADIDPPPPTMSLRSGRNQPSGNPPQPDQNSPPPRGFSASNSGSARNAPLLDRSNAPSVVNQSPAFRGFSESNPGSSRSAIPPSTLPSLNHPLDGDEEDRESERGVSGNMSRSSSFYGGSGGGRARNLFYASADRRRGRGRFASSSDRNRHHTEQREKKSSIPAQMQCAFVLDCIDWQLHRDERMRERKHERKLERAREQTRECSNELLKMCESNAPLRHGHNEKIINCLGCSEKRLSNEDKSLFYINARPSSSPRFNFKHVQSPFRSSRDVASHKPPRWQQKYHSPVGLNNSRPADSTKLKRARERAPPVLTDTGLNHSSQPASEYMQRSSLSLKEWPPASVGLNNSRPVGIMRRPMNDGTSRYPLSQSSRFSLNNSRPVGGARVKLESEHSSVWYRQRRSDNPYGLNNSRPAGMARWPPDNRAGRHPLLSSSYLGLNNSGPADSADLKRGGSVQSRPANNRAS